jgi:MFS family permease
LAVFEIPVEKRFAHRITVATRLSGFGLKEQFPERKAGRLMLAPIRTVIPILFSAFFMVAGISLGNLLVPLRANAEGWSPATIGLIGTAYASAFTIGCILAPRFIMRFGVIRTLVSMLGLLGVSLALIALFVHPWSWALFRAMTGFCAAGAYSLIEGWLNEKSENQNRGLVFSWYMIACLIGLIGGQYLLPLSSPLHLTLFLVGALCFWAAILPVWLSGMTPPELPTSVRLDFAGVLKNSPAAAVGNVVSGILFGTWVGFAALFAHVNGYSGSGIANLMMCGTMGGLLLQFPIGRLSDFIDRRIVMAMLGGAGLALSTVTAIWMPVFPTALAALYFCFGATLHPGYALNVAYANDHAAQSSRVSLSSTMLVTYGLGSITGPFIAGFAINVFGYRALFVWLAVGYLIYLMFPLWRMTKRAAPEKETGFLETAIKPVVAQQP